MEILHIYMVNIAQKEKEKREKEKKVIQRKEREKKEREKTIVFSLSYFLF